MNLVHLHPSARDYFCGPLGSCRQGRDQKLLVIPDRPLDAYTGGFQPHGERFFWADAQRGMDRRIVNLKEIFAQPFFQCDQSPHGVLLGADRLRYLPHVTRDLRVAAQIMDELGVRRAEQSFTDRPKACLRRWTRFLGHFIASQQSFEIGALELRATINHKNLG